MKKYEVVMHKYFPKLLHLKVKIFNFLHNFASKNNGTNMKFRNYTSSKSKRKLIRALMPNPHAHISAGIYASL